MAKTPAQVKAGAAFIELTLSNDQFQKEWAKFRSSLSKINGVLGRIGTAAAGFGAAITFGFGRMAVAAANAETGFRRFSLIFADNADLMENKLRGLSSRTGIAMTTLMRQASSFGAIFSELGEQLGPDQFTDIVAKAQKAVIDLSGIAGITTEEAADRIKSALTSTGESVDQYGFNLRQAEINQELMRMGINKNVRQLTELEKQLVKIQIIQKSIERGQLDFTNMTSTLNAKIAILRSNLEELWVTLSRFIMPILKVIVTVINMFVRVLTSFPVNWIVSALGLVVAMAGLLSLGIGSVLLTFVALSSAITWAVTAAIGFQAAMASMSAQAFTIGMGIWSLSGAFTALSASIASATTLLLGFLSAAWPFLLVAGLIAAIPALAWYGVYKSVQNINAAAAEGDTGANWIKGGLEGFRRSTDVPWMFGQVKDAIFGGGEEDDPTKPVSGARPRATSVASVIGSRLISQQLAYGTGVSTPAQESAKHLSHLSMIADQVTDDGQLKVTQAS